MNNTDLKKEEIILEKEYKYKLHSLRQEYTNANAKFKIGDFVFNVTGIIKIEKIKYEIFMNSLEINYIGYRYKKDKTGLSRTKDNKLSTLRHSLKLIVV